MRHQFIKAEMSQLNGKVERSHLTDKKNLSKLPFTDAVNVNEKLNK